ncbi:MAG: hypothetical protein IPL84_03840 [Chitinophagaceae bacterium]|nr:hypothetical protein [Chitinophagaceae bacterium]
MPGTALNAGIFEPQSYLGLTTSYVEYQCYVAPQSIVSGTSYWLVVKLSAAPVGGSMYVDRSGTGNATHAYSTNGSSWTTENNKAMWFKIYSISSYGGEFWSTNRAGVFGYSPNEYGGHFYSINDDGAYGVSIHNDGVAGVSTYANGGSFRSTHGYGLSGISTNNYGGNFYSTNAGGLISYSSKSHAIYGWSDSTYPFIGRIDNLRNDNTEVLMLLGRRTRYTAEDNIGASIRVEIEDSAGQDTYAGQLKFVLTDVTNGAEKSAVVLGNRSGEKLFISDGGVSSDASYNFAEDTSSTDAYKIALYGATSFTTYKGFMITFIAQNANNGAATLQINGSSAYPLKKETRPGFNYRRH